MKAKPRVERGDGEKTWKSKNRGHELNPTLGILSQGCFSLFYYFNYLLSYSR
jgi:hypothetical protein